MNYYSSNLEPVVQNLMKREREALERVTKGNAKKAEKKNQPTYKTDYNLGA